LEGKEGTGSPPTSEDTLTNSKSRLVGRGGFGDGRKGKGAYRKKRTKIKKKHHYGDCVPVGGKVGKKEA